jgi:hypothetical protein
MGTSMLTTLPLDYWNEREPLNFHEELAFRSLNQDHDKCPSLDYLGRAPSLDYYEGGWVVEVDDTMSLGDDVIYNRGDDHC